MSHGNIKMKLMIMMAGVVMLDGPGELENNSKRRAVQPIEQILGQKPLVFIIDVTFILIAVTRCGFLQKMGVKELLRLRV